MVSIPVYADSNGYAITADGSLWGWGEASKLGTGATSDAVSPTKFPGLTGVVQVIAGMQGGTHEALLGTGQVLSWGAVYSTDLGNGTFVGSATPVNVLQVSGVDYVAATTYTGLAAGQSPTPVGGIPAAAELYGSSNPGEKCVCGTGSAADPVNTQDGNYSESTTDLSIPGRGLPLTFSRTYNALNATATGPLGHGWSESYAMTVTISGATATVTQENGSTLTFTRSGTTYTAGPRVLATLAHNVDGTWTLVRQRRTTFNFDATGKLTAESDLNGYTTTITYPSSTSEIITDPAGRTFTLTLSGGLISKITDSAARSVRFAYDANNNLSTVTDANGGITTFTYNAAHQLLTTRQPKYNGDVTTSPTPVTTNGYDANGRVTSQSDQIGRTTMLDYDSIPDATLVTDPLGNQRVDTYSNGQLASQTSGYGTTAAKTWRYYYDPATLGIAARCDPKG